MLRPKNYVVELSADERAQLTAIVSKGRVLAQKRLHAQILLKADQAPGAPAWTDKQVADSIDVSVRTVERVRQRLVEHGPEDALTRRTNPYGSLSMAFRQVAIGRPLGFSRPSVRYGHLHAREDVHRRGLPVRLHWQMASRYGDDHQGRQGPERDEC